MALAELFRGLAQQMLTPGGIFENVPIEAIYVRQANPDYDPTTGHITEHPSSYTIAGVIDRPSTRSIDNVNVFPTDQWFYVAGITFTEAGLTARNKPDDILQLQGENWNVVRIRTDPVNAVVILEVRRP